jgi:hypothetical protein
MVRHHDSLQEMPNISDVHPKSYDVDNHDDDDDNDEVATYTIAHIGATARKNGPLVLNCSNGRSGRGGGEDGKTDLLSNERNEGRQRPPRSSPVASAATIIPTKPLRDGMRYHTNFTAWKRKKDSKIVGLKHYGLESPRHQLHNTLSDLDDQYSNQSKYHGTTPQQLASSVPKRSMFTWWMGCAHENHHHHPYRNKSNNNSNTTTPTNLYMENKNHSNRSKHRLFAVEKEEERVRKHVTKNPFVLFYLGNLAAIKVLIYYFSKFFHVHHTLLLIRRRLCGDPKTRE